MSGQPLDRQDVLDASRTGLCLFDSDGELVCFNAAWNALLGPGSEHGEGWRTFVGTLIADLAALADADRTPVLEIHAAGDRRLSLGAAELADGGVVLSVDDVTDRQRELRARDRLLVQMVGAHDVETRRIAAVLHDDAVQRLTALGLRLELRAVESADDALAELAREAGAITASLRRLLVDLHPALLESQGLHAAVEAAGRALDACGIDFSVEPLDERLPAPVEQLAYRLVQEALANVLEHAQATRVRVAFIRTPRALHCRVVDDGRGFDPAARGDAAAIGLEVARRRAELAGGTLNVDSDPGRGTTFTFELPLVATEPPAREAVA